jgi:hypothetical protein
MPTFREVTVAVLALLTVEACRIRRLPELPPEQDPAEAIAPATPYVAPADLLTGSLDKPTVDAADEHEDDSDHAHHHHHHGGAR